MEPCALQTLDKIAQLLPPSTLRLTPVVVENEAAPRAVRQKTPKWRARRNQVKAEENRVRVRGKKSCGRVIQLRDGGRRKRGSTAAACNTIRGTERERGEGGRQARREQTTAGAGTAAGREPGRQPEAGKQEGGDVGRQEGVGHGMRKGGREAEEEEEDAEKLVPLHFVVPEESGVSASKTCMAYAYVLELVSRNYDADF